MTQYYTTADIASLLGINIQKVTYYIKQGYLIAKKEGKKYLIDFNDFIYFKNNYFCSEQHKKQRGAKTLTKEAHTLLKNIVLDLEKEDISLREFIKKYPNIYILPHSNIYIKFKRDNCIKAEAKRGNKISDIAKKYALSEIRVREILREEGVF